MTGRPREFDRDDALQSAMDLFWRKGYAATGMAELTEEMGIARQSLYNAFGDKHELFVEAVERYIDENSQAILETLSAPGPPLDNIRKALEMSVEFVTGGDCRGCLVTNSIVELAPHDTEVRALMRSLLARVDAALKRALDGAIERGELDPETDTRKVARFLNNTLHGLVVRGKAAASRNELLDVVEVALSVLR